MLTFVGIPVFMIELSMGQFGASGPMTVWEAAPLFQGKSYKHINLTIIQSKQVKKIVRECLESLGS